VVIIVADIETRVDKLETKVSELDLRVDRVITKLDMFIAESREARQRQDAEIRAAREKHDADMREMRERQETAQAKHDADMKEMQKNICAKMDNMDAKIEGIGNHVRNITIATMVGIGAAVTGVAAMVVAILLK
jgi:predicted RNase H-like nuclease (RuvC/YqgF family)